MNDASDARNLPDTACPSCGTVQPPARRCRDCGAVLPWTRPKPMFKGRERALAAAGRRRLGARWTAWIAACTAVAGVVALVAVQWQGGPPPERPVAERAAELARDHPEFARRMNADPLLAAQVRAGLEQALRSGASREEALARAEALLQQLRVERHFAAIAAAAPADAVAAAPAPAPAPAPTDGAGRATETVAARTAGATPAAEGPDSVALGAAGKAVGVGQLPTRRCFDIGDGVECIEIFEDPSLLSDSTNPADVKKRLETLRRKAEESREILKGL